MRHYVLSRKNFLEIFRPTFFYEDYTQITEITAVLNTYSSAVLVHVLRGFLFIARLIPAIREKYIYLPIKEYEKVEFACELIK